MDIGNDYDPFAITFGRRIMVALFIAGSAISIFSLSSCGGVKKGDTVDEEKLVSRTVDSINMITTENGKISNILRAPLMEDHAFAKAAFTEYRQGLEYLAYNDSTGLVSLHVVADYALHWTDRDLYELKGNVVVTGENDRRLYTQQLYWDIKLKKIYSNVDSKVEEGRDVFIGEGFEADDDFSRWTFRKFTGTVGVDLEPSEQRPAADSVAVGNGVVDASPPPPLELENDSLP